MAQPQRPAVLLVDDALIRRLIRTTLRAARTVPVAGAPVCRASQTPGRIRLVVRELGHFVVCHPGICHGQPTIRGTRIMVKGILEQLSEGMSWDEIVADWRGDVTHEVIAEVIQLASKAFLEQAEVALVSA